MISCRRGDTTPQRIHLNGLPVAAAAQPYTITAAPDVFAARLMPCDFDPGSSVLEVTLKPESAAEAGTVSGKITIHPGNRGGSSAAAGAPASSAAADEPPITVPFVVFAS
jgi:hypothetical protein